MAEPWTRERVLQLVAGREISCTDQNAATIEPPEWIFATGATTSEATSGQRIAVTHPSDRQRLIDSWWDAVRRPGEIIEIEVRARLDGDWVLTHTRQVNLLDDPEVGALLAAIEFGRPVSGEDFEEVIQEGEFEEGRWLIHTLDEAGVIVTTEGKVEEITGRRPEDVIGQPVIEHLHPDGFNDAILGWMEIQNGPPGTIRTARTRVVRPDGSVIWVESTMIKRTADDGRSIATLIVHDLTDRRKQEAALKVSQQAFRLLADQVPAAVFATDAEQRIGFRNERWRLELDGDDPVDRLEDIVHPDDRAAHAEQLQRLDTGRADATAAYEVRSADGERVFAISCRTVLDLVNETRNYIGSVTDVTATVQLREWADRDALTGLWNRRATEERLNAALAEEPGSTAVVFIDLDGFKDVNDTFGHHAGDHVLKTLAARLLDNLRPDDVIGRFGGDEFVIVIPHTDDQVDRAVLGRLDDAMAEPITWSGGSWSPQGSIGMAHGRPGEDAAALIIRADQRMFTDKRQRKALS
jgi:diguanylate cyclase (GGDEF)-like protein/PAS domain S-box-containing protein